MVAGGLLVQANAASASVQLDIDAGILTGARNVLVDGSYYDVSFRDGNCSSFFGASNCGTFQGVGTGYIMNTQALAEAAAMALLNTVFTDSVLGNFDSRPELTRGCTNLSSCGVIVPHTLDRNGVGSTLSMVANNRATEVDDAVTTLTSNLFLNTTIQDNRVWAVFSVAAAPPPPPVTAVPEPSVWASLITGFGLVGAVARRRRVRTA